MGIAHAKLSASGSSRWLNCPGSVQAESEFKDYGSSFAQEGTAAHELSDICLKNNHDPQAYLLNTIEAVVVDQEMVDYVQGYIDFVKSFSGEHFYEQRVDFSRWVHEGFGTSDAIVIQKDTVHVIDLKYGRGVVVDAENNSQGMLYALGVYNDFEFMLDSVNTFSIHIYQPRIGNFSEWSISVKELLKWGEWVKLQSDLAMSKDAPREAGEKQCQWCKAKATCKTLADYTQKIIMCEFDDLDELQSPDKIDNKHLRMALENKSLIVGWLDAVEKHITTTLLNGDPFDGFKIVEGRSTRKWSSESEAKKALLSLRDESEIYTKKLLSPTQAVKLLGKADSAKLEDVIVKPSGKPTLAKESDKRPALDNSLDLFEEIT